jgi:outer membrane protein OmpA-like peptidoglycan-associated protein
MKKFLLVVLFIGSMTRAESVVKKVKLGPEINSLAREILPLISADGKTLYFTREYYVDDDLRRWVASKIQVPALSEKEREAFLNRKDIDEKMKADFLKMLSPTLPADVKLESLTHQTIWRSERTADGRWSTATKVVEPLNNLFASWVASVLPDGNTLLVGGVFNERSSDSSLVDWMRSFETAEVRSPLSATPGKQKQPEQRIVALTARARDGWSFPQYLKIADFQTTSYRNDFFLAPGNRVLILSIVNNEGVGDRDLFVSFRQDDGTWTKPKNPGAVVNSTGAEISPFVAPDGKSLYFASNRAGGFGGYDMYFSKRLDETWLKWSPPENLGSEINTVEDEANLSLDALGNYAFMSIGQSGKEDIYTFAVPEKMRPLPVAFIRGRVHDPNDQSVSATINYERLRDGVEAGEANADPASGRYQIALAVGEEYSFRAGAPGYIAVSDRVDLTKAKAGDEFKRDLLLVPMKVGATIRLSNIFFDFGKATLLPESKVELDRLVRILAQNPTMEIEIDGHTDSVGDEKSNQALSEARAGAVMRYLLDAGIDARRLASKGYGVSRPVAPNNTDEGRQQNRRVEFVIFKM